MVTGWAFQQDTSLFQLILKVENRLVQRIATSPSWKWSCCEAHFNSLKSPKYLLLNCFVLFFCHVFFMNSAQILGEAFEDPINFHECGTAEPSYFRWQRFVPWTYIRNIVNGHHSVWRGVILIMLDWQVPRRILRQIVLWHWLDKPAIDWLAAFWHKWIFCALTRVQKGGRTHCFEDATSMIVFCSKGLVHVYRDGMTRLNMAHQTQGSLWEEEFSAFGRSCKNAGS